MTHQEALEKLRTRGLVGDDAVTALNAAKRINFQTVDEVLAFAAPLSTDDVLRYFGQDGGRAVLALRA